jgi:hypothetical protein
LFKVIVIIKKNCLEYGGYGTIHREWRGVMEVKIPAHAILKPEAVWTPGVFDIF